jgi:adenylate cyclase
VSRERRNFRKAFTYYLPAGIVDELVQNIDGLKTSDKLVNGICLSTDAEQYTTLSESMVPKELAQFMNRYYEAVFDPVRRHGGMVSNVVGDSMLALWLATGGTPAPLNEACLAAIEIEKAIREFRKSPHGIGLPTRSAALGEILLGNIGAAQHYEYRAVGDIVNTATRIEGLNKYLGTRILVSREVLSMADTFLARDLGWFLLAGKTRPVHVYELGGLLEEASPRRKVLRTFEEDGVFPAGGRRRPGSSMKRSGSGTATAPRSFSGALRALLRTRWRWLGWCRSREKK